MNNSHCSIFTAESYTTGTLWKTSPPFFFFLIRTTLWLQKCDRSTGLEDWRKNKGTWKPTSEFYCIFEQSFKAHAHHLPFLRPKISPEVNKRFKKKKNTRHVKDDKHEEGGRCNNGDWITSKKTHAESHVPWRRCELNKSHDCVSHVFSVMHNASWACLSALDSVKGCSHCVTC